MFILGPEADETHNPLTVGRPRCCISVLTGRHPGPMAQGCQKREICSTAPARSRLEPGIFNQRGLAGKEFAR
jgi:hypothetical protein